MTTKRPRGIIASSPFNILKEKPRDYEVFLYKNFPHRHIISSDVPVGSDLDPFGGNIMPLLSGYESRGNNIHPGSNLALLGGAGVQSTYGSGCNIYTCFRDEFAMKINTGLPEKTLRMMLLYFDKIFLPYSSDGTEFGHLTDDLMFLIQNGIVLPTKVPVAPNASLAEIFFELQRIPLEEIENRLDISTCLCQSSDRIFLPEAVALEQISLQMDLYNVLPIPGQDTPFQEILEFRAKFSNEIEKLHEYLDNLADNLFLSTINPQYARNSAVAQLEEAVNDVLLSTRESKIKFQFNDLTWSYEFDKSSFAIASAALPLSVLDVSLSPAIAIALSIVSSIKIRWGGSVGVKRSSSHQGPLSVLVKGTEYFRELK